MSLGGVAGVFTIEITGEGGFSDGEGYRPGLQLKARFVLMIRSKVPSSLMVGGRRCRLAGRQDGGRR